MLVRDELRLAWKEYKIRQQQQGAEAKSCGQGRQFPNVSISVSVEVILVVKQVGIKSDTKLTDMHCVSMAGDRFCAGQAHLERATCPGGTPPLAQCQLIGSRHLCNAPKG